MKRFLIKSFILVIPVLLIIVYPNVLKFKTSGDLGALGLIFFDDSYRSDFGIKKVEFQSLYCKSVLELSESNTSTDVLIIGDSFAHTGSQDYLSEYVNVNITTLYHKLEIEALDIFSTLMLKKRYLIPRVVIIESVERHFVQRLLNMQLDVVLNVDSIYYKPKLKTKTYLGNAQDFYKKKLELVGDGPVNNVKLSRNLFTCKSKESDLYFYTDDIFECHNSDIKDAFENLVLLHNYAKEKGVFLIFMVAADKYDVYQNYIVNNPYKPNNLLSKGNHFDSLPYFINTKTVLNDAVEKGIKDVYWADDTHWSPIGAQIVAEEIAKRLQKLELLEVGK